MNTTLLIGSLTALGLMAFVIWMYRVGRSRGASQQKEENRRANSAYTKEHHKDWYNGNVGTDALGVRDKGKWVGNTTPNIKPRVESRKNGDRGRGRNGGKVHDA